MGPALSCCMDTTSKQKSISQSKTQVTLNNKIEAPSPTKQRQPEPQIEKIQKSRSKNLSSIQNFSIPEAKVVSGSSSDQIAGRLRQILDYNSTIELYKNFSRAKVTNSSGQIVTKDIFEAITIILFEVLIQQEFEAIQNQIVYIQQFPQLRKRIKQYSSEYGEVEKNQQLLKLFLQYIVMMKGNLSAIELVEKYTIIESVLERIIMGYVAHVSPERKLALITAYMSEEFSEEFITRILDCFKISHSWSNNNQTLTISSKNYEATINIQEGENSCITTINNRNPNSNST